MTARREPRESRSVRLRDDEWVTAEAIARLKGENGAGFGLRTALARESHRLMRSADRVEFEALVQQIRRERAEEVTR